MSRPGSCPVWLGILMFLCSSVDLGAEPLHLFYSRHQSPIVQIFGIPAAEDGALVPPGATDIRLVADASSSFSGGSDRDERLGLDGETYRFALVVRRGWNGFELGLDIPYVAHEDGRLDGFINDFHEWTGLTSNLRKRVSQNRLNYFYAKDGDTELAVREPTSGLGDLSLAAGFPLFRDRIGADRALAVRLGLKLPTGDPDRLLGSGSTDLSIRLAVHDPQTFRRARLTLLGQMGVLGIWNSEVLEEQVRPLAVFGTGGFGWQPFSWLALKAQIDWHSPLFSDSDLRELGDWAPQAVFGGTFFLPGEVSLDWALGENIIVETAPDVAFHLNLGKRF